MVTKALHPVATRRDIIAKFPTFEKMITGAIKEGQAFSGDLGVLLFLGVLVWFWWIAVPVGVIGEIQKFMADGG